MKLQPMSYKSYVWPFNPEKVQVEYARNLYQMQLPLFGSILQDLGCDKRVVTGSGEFVGNSCMVEFNQLAAVFAAGGSGTLRLPGDTPFTAAFSSLKMIGAAQPDCVSYSFIFVEDENIFLTNTTSPQKSTYICAGGENLWGVANLCNTDVDTLKALNPMIQWPNRLEAGRKVVLP